MADILWYPSQRLVEAELFWLLESVQKTTSGEIFPSSMKWKLPQRICPGWRSWDLVIWWAHRSGGGRLNCYLGVYPISRIKHWYWSQHFLLDRVPLTGDGWRRRARRARVKRGRFVKITIANCNPQTPGLSLVKDDDCFNFSPVWDDKENTTRSWAIIVKLMEREEKELMTWIKTIHWETPDSWRE